MQLVPLQVTSVVMAAIGSHNAVFSQNSPTFLYLLPPPSHFIARRHELPFFAKAAVSPSPCGIENVHPS